MMMMYVLMFELFMYVYSCNALSAQSFAVDRPLNSYFMIMMMMYVCDRHRGCRTQQSDDDTGQSDHRRDAWTHQVVSESE